MVQSLPDVKNTGTTDEISKHQRIISDDFKERSLWLIKLRWCVPPSILVVVLLARLIGFDFKAGAIVSTAVFIAVYNVILFLLSRKLEKGRDVQVKSMLRFTCWQVGLDYSAMFLLIYFTGGVASPVIFFFIFHIIFASILLPPYSAYGFSSVAVFGITMIAVGEYLGWISPHALFFRTMTIDITRQPVHVMVYLIFFAATVFITAFSTTTIMRVLRKRVIDLAETSDTVIKFNHRFNSLFSMITAIGSIKNLQQVLDIVTSELVAVMNVKAISVKLLSEDNKYLRYVAGYGLPLHFLKDRIVQVDKSPLNRRIIEGEPFTTGRLTQREMFQFGEDLAAAQIQSVLFVPLTVEDRVIGILGAYCVLPDRFKDKDVDFFRLAAGLVAIGLDNARSYEAIENFVKERSRFMTRVAHNLRAPVAAVLSMLEVLKEEHLGKLNEEQAVYLERVDRRAQTMLSMINELMTLATSRTATRKIEKRPLEIDWLAGRLQRTFQDKAAEKGIDFEVSVMGKLPPVWGDSDMIEQMLENLVSNAIKYTPHGGKVRVVFSEGTEKTISIQVNDNGIGIPKDSMARLFSEFFRAQNAKDVEEIGTGLGLAIVKEIAELHKGRVIVESEEGCGTTFVVSLPKSSIKGNEDENSTN